MKLNGTIFSKPQQDQLKRALENGGGGGGSLTKHVVEMTTANYETTTYPKWQAQSLI